MPFVNQNIVPKLARLNFTTPKHNDRHSYFQQYLSIIKRNTTRLNRSDSTETLPDNSDRSYKSRCSSIDDIVEYSKKPEFQIEQQLYDELREKVNSCQNPAIDDYDMFYASNAIEPPASCASTIGSIDLKEANISPEKIKIISNKKLIFESSYCSRNNFSNNKQICTPNNNNSNNNNNNGNDIISKINVAGGRIRGGGRPLPDSNNIKSKQSAITKRRLDYSKTISIRNQKIMSSRKEKNKMSGTEIQANTKTNDVISTKKNKNKKTDIGSGGSGSGGCRKKFNKYHDFRCRNVNNAKIFNQEKLRKELKYLRDRHLSDTVLANEIRKMTLTS